MTITQLRAFLAAYTFGTFTAAAANLETSQASVSELISRLEAEVGLALFARGTRGLIPTSAAVELRVHAQQTVTSFDNGVEALRSIASLEGGVCTFGILRNANYYGLSDLAQRFHKLHPAVKLRLVGLTSPLTTEAVVRGEVEAALVVLPVVDAGLVVKPLFRDEVMYASATRDPSRGPVTMGELAAATLVLYDASAGWMDSTRNQILERAQLQGLRIDPVMEVEHVETALSLVSDGEADTIVCRTIARSPAFPRNVATVPFEEPFYDTISLIRREGAFMSLATRKIAELAEQTLLRHVGPTIAPRE